MEREKRLVKVFTIISIICVFIVGVLESISFHEIWLEFDRFFWLHYTSYCRELQCEMVRCAMYNSHVLGYIGDK